MITAFIGIGSNLHQPVLQVQNIIRRFTENPAIQLIKVSNLYQSKAMSAAMDVDDQPDFINAVAEIKTSFSAFELLNYLQMLEKKQGRIRAAKRWSARIIDLDILLYGDEIIATENLTIPHYGMKQRDFVIYPLCEIAPDLILPTGENIQELKRTCMSYDLQILSKEKI